MAEKKISGLPITNTLDNEALFIVTDVTDKTESPEGTSKSIKKGDLLNNITVPTNTSDLLNDGADGTSTYVENDELSTVATSGDYNDLSNTPAPITQTSELTNNGSDNTSTYVEADEIGTTAVTNSYNDLDDKPTIPSQNTNTSQLINDGSDSTSVYVEADEIGTVAVSNEYNDLDNKPSIPTQTSDITNNGADNTSTYVEADELSTVATTGSYNDLTDKPTIPTQPTQTSELTNNGSDGTSTYVENDEIGAVATSNSYNDLDDKPTIPTPNTNTSDLVNNGSDGTSVYTEADEFKTVGGNSVIGSGDIPFTALVLNTYFINTDSGNDGTGKYEDANLPYLTLQAAIDDGVTNGLTGNVNFVIQGSTKAFITKQHDLSDFEITINSEFATVSYENFDFATHGTDVYVTGTGKLTITAPKIIVGQVANETYMGNGIRMFFETDELELLHTLAMGTIGQLVLKTPLTTFSGVLANFNVNFTASDLKSEVDFGTITYGGTGTLRPIYSTNSMPIRFSFDEIVCTTATGLLFETADDDRVDMIKIGNINAPVTSINPNISVFGGYEIDTSAVDNWNCKRALVQEGATLIGGGDFTAILEFIVNRGVKLKDGHFKFHYFIGYQNDSEEMLELDNALLGVKHDPLNTGIGAAYDYSLNTNPLINVVGGYNKIYNLNPTGTKNLFGFNFTNKSNVRVNADNGILEIGDRIITTDGIHVVNWILEKQDNSDYASGNKLSVQNDTLTESYEIPFDESLTFDSDDFDVDDSGKVIRYLPAYIDISNMSYVDNAAAVTGGVPLGAAYWNTTSNALVERI